jgi:hypothetical protein
MNMHTPDEDPIVAEVRRFREEYAARFGYDMKLIDEDTKRRARVLREMFAPHDQDENAKINELADDEPEVRLIREEYAAKFGYDLKLRRFAARNEADDKSNGAP